MRTWQRVTIASLLTAALALPSAGPATGHDRNDHDRDREQRDRDIERDQRDAEERELKDADDAARRTEDIDAKSSDSSLTTSSDSALSAKTSGTSGTSGSDSGSSNSGAGSSSGSSSGSGSDVSIDDSSGSNSGSSNSGSDDDEDNSGSNSGSSNSGSDDDEDEDDSDSLIGSTKDHRIDVETDAQGRERRRGEFLVSGDRELAQALRAAGFRTLSERHLTNLDTSVVRVRVRDGSSVETDIVFARRIANARDAEPNFLYRLSGTHILPTVAAVAASPTTNSNIARVGVVDTGADNRTPVLRDRIAAMRGFGGPYTARAHGTHVAQILAREGVHVEVADVFQADAQGAPVATAESIARGIDWMAARRIPVVNVSITGPSSSLLSSVVAHAIARGTIIVAAAGNDGPAAPPVYPAAFPDVVGVTAVDTGGRVYRRANRGDYVDFAALGVRVPVNGTAGATEYVTGTSYAAPIIAAAFARRYTEARPGGANAEVARMQSDATDLGELGRDPVFGWGRVQAASSMR